MDTTWVKRSLKKRTLQLLNAIKDRKNETISELLGKMDAKEVNTVHPNWGGNVLSPLHLACKENNVFAVERLLAFPGIDVNVRNHLGYTPILLTFFTNDSLTKFKQLHGPHILQVRKLMLDDLRVDFNIVSKDGKKLENIFEKSKKILRMIKEARSRRERDNIIQVEDNIMQIEFHTIQVEDISVEVNDITVQVDDNTIQFEDKTIQIEDKTIQIEDKTIQIEDNTIQVENNTIKVESDLEKVRINIKAQYNDKIGAIEEIEAGERKIKENQEQRRKNVKNMEDKQDLEMADVEKKLNQEINDWEQIKVKVEQQLAEVQQEINKSKDTKSATIEEMKNQHKDERTIVENDCRKEEDEEEKYLGKLQEMRTQLNKDFGRHPLDKHGNMEGARETLECPICMEIMKPPSRIWMCPSTHLICEPCKDQLEESKLCPTCRAGNVTLRAFIAENFARTLFQC